MCKCVLYYCHQVTTQLQLTNISYHIISKVGSIFNVKKCKQFKTDCLAAEDEENIFHRNVGRSVTQWNGIIYQRKRFIRHFTVKLSNTVRGRLHSKRCNEPPLATHVGRCQSKATILWCHLHRFSINLWIGPHVFWHRVTSAVYHEVLCNTLP